MEIKLNMFIHIQYTMIIYIKETEKTHWNMDFCTMTN